MGLKEQFRMNAFLAAAVATSNEINEYFNTGRRKKTEQPYRRPADLPKWRYGEHIIYAKDEKTAMKYVKKRGFWKEGYSVKLIEL